MNIFVLLLQIDVGMGAVADYGGGGFVGLRFDAHAVRAANADDGGHLHAGVGAAAGFDNAEGVDLIAGIFFDGVGGVEEEFAGVGLLGGCRRGGWGGQSRARRRMVLSYLVRALRKGRRALGNRGYGSSFSVALPMVPS